MSMIPALVGVDATTKQQEAIRNGEELAVFPSSLMLWDTRRSGQRIETTAPRRNLL